MSSLQGKNMVDELEEFFGELKLYQQYRFAFLLKQLPKSQIESMERLREKLVRNTGRFKPIITELTGREHVTRFEKGQEQKFDMWFLGLRQFSRSKICDSALRYCIDATNQAIGKVKSEVEMGYRDQQGSIVGKLASITMQPPKAFIAHGGESPARDKVVNFLDALGITPVIVEEQPSEGRSKDKNVEHYLKQCDCAIILATKGDVDGRTGEFIPRGNILIEISRCQEILPVRTVYLLEEGAKFPTNIDEKVWERFSEDYMDKALIKVTKELRAFGLIKAMKP